MIAANQFHQAELSGRRRVVVVDDNPVLVRCIGRALAELGLPVDCFTSPLKALDQVLAGDVAVVVSDVSMPVLSGLELLARIRAIAPTVRVILLSGFEAPDAAPPLGAYAYLVKPVRPQTLIDAVQGALNSEGTSCRRDSAVIPVLSQMPAPLTG